MKSFMVKEYQQIKNKYFKDLLKIITLMAMAFSYKEGNFNTGGCLRKI